MMKNGDMPAMPIEINGFGQYAPEVYGGLTKREMFAMAAMQGLLDDSNVQTISAVNIAVECADLLLRKLAGEDINPPVEPNPDWPVMPTKAGE
jgi:hypothetical protein